MSSNRRAPRPAPRPRLGTARPRPPRPRSGRTAPPAAQWFGRGDPSRRRVPRAWYSPGRLPRSLAPAPLSRRSPQPPARPAPAMVRPRRAPHRSGAGGPLGGRGRPPRPLTVRAVRSRSWPASPRGPQPPRIRARSAPPMVSPPPSFQSLPRPRPRARVFVRGPLLSGIAWGAPKGGPAWGRVPPWNPPVVRAGLSPLLRFRARVAGVGSAGGRGRQGSNYC